ncbi:MAG: hypothetical protein BWK78_06205, partial [Thiotrichaceae bacterium IS1]
MTILNEELFTLYQTELTGQAVTLPALPISYTDFVRWETEQLNDDSLSQLTDYWQTQLAGEIPVLNLPTDHSRPVVPSYQGASQRFSLSPSLTQQLSQLARQENTTLFTLLLASFQLLLHRYTGQTEIWVGTPTSLPRQQPQFAKLVGYLVNPVVLRATFEAATHLSFRGLLNQTQQTVLGALEHSAYPFPLLVKLLQPHRDFSQVPLVQAMLEFQPDSWLSQRQVAGLTLLPMELDQMEG